MTLENQVSALESAVKNLDQVLINVGDRMDHMDDGNAMMQNFAVAELRNTDHLDLIAKIGGKVSGKIHTTANVNYPTAIKVFTPGQATIISYYQRLIDYTPNWDIDSIYPIAYENPTPAANKGIAYSTGFDINQSNGDIAICSYIRHIVRVYAKDGALKFQIGVTQSTGHQSANKLWNPSKCIFLPNGNILVVNHNGRGKDATNHGHLSEYSGKDGSFVATRLGFYSDGQSTIGSNILYKPMGLDIDKKDPNLIWVTEYTRGRLLLINLTTWVIEDIYYPGAGYNYLNSYGVASLSDGNVAIASNVQGSIMIIDRTTKEIIRELDVTKVGAAPDFRDVKELEPGFLVFSSWSATAVFVMPIKDTTEIPYDQPPLPFEASLITDVQFPGYDADTGILTRKISDLGDVPAKLAVPYTKLV